MRSALIPLSLALATTAHAQALANAEIIRVERGGRTPPNELLDQRDAAIDRLSEFIDIKTTDTPINSPEKKK